MSLRAAASYGAAAQGLRLLQGGTTAAAPRLQGLARPASAAGGAQRQLCSSSAALGLAATAAAAAGRRRLGRAVQGQPRIARRDGATKADVYGAPVLESILFRSATGPKVGTSPTRADQWRGGAMVLFVREGEEGGVELGRIGEAMNKELDGAVEEFIQDEAFEAKEGSAKTFRTFGKDVKRVVLVGLGKGKGSDWRLAGAVAAAELKAMKGGSAGLACVDGVDVQALVEGVLLGLHVDKRFRGSKTPEKDKAVAGPESVELLGAFPAGCAATVEKAQAMASGVIFCRELVNGSPNVVTPPNMADAAVDMAKKCGLTAKILEEAECEAMGMGSFLAVGRCSDLPSKLIHLTYKSDDEPKRKIGIVGKGLTFDAGGYNIKAGAGSMIEMMKFDMGGSAATLGAAAAIGQLKPKGVEVHFIVAACENMISGNPGSLHPGDIITAMDGTTIEVNNTDAEGRLTLADAILYAQKQGVTEVVDIATLTGACMVALGEGIAGMWSNSDDYAATVEAASKSANEKLWRMPLEESYFEGLKSDFADMKNTGPRFGGAITAALFLNKFVQKDIKWAHLDIAGTVWSDKPKAGNQNAQGGTGSMVRTLTELVKGA